MGEVSEKVARLSETELLTEFRTALVALYPILRRLDCLEDDTQPYDDFDKLAKCLWDVLIRNSLPWKYGLPLLQTADATASANQERMDLSRLLVLD